MEDLQSFRSFSVSAAFDDDYVMARAVIRAESRDGAVEEVEVTFPVMALMPYVPMIDQFFRAAEQADQSPPVLVLPQTSEDVEAG